MAYFSNAGVYLVNMILGLFLLCVLLRFLLQYFRAEFRNPISQFFVTVTNPFLKPLRRFVPGFRGIDFASIVLALLVAGAQVFLTNVLQGAATSLAGVIVGSLAEVAKTIVYIFIITIIIRIVISWIQPQGPANPALNLIYSLTEPVLRPARSILPPIGGLDLSPILTMIVLTLILIVPVQFLSDLARVL